MKTKKGRIPNNIVGKRFGRLIVLGYAKNTRWYCRCDCGKLTINLGYNLKSGHSNSCGCLRDERGLIASTKHGHARKGHPTATWHTWQSMKRRCLNPKRNDFYLYGGRGIAVCERWMEFENFLDDMGEKPNGLSLGRIDNSGNYCPENCEWQTSEEQGSNKRNNHIIEFDGKKQTVSQWARFLECNPDVLFCRLRRGWSETRTLTQPLST
jgi:hypothetical protein